MRLNLYWRGRDVIDIEVHVWRLRDEDDEDEGPALQASGHLAASELADGTPSPDTYAQALSFGFGRHPR